MYATVFKQTEERVFLPPTPFRHSSDSIMQLQHVDIMNVSLENTEDVLELFEMCLQLGISVAVILLTITY